MGAWIEITRPPAYAPWYFVAPLVGAWIEIVCTVTIPSLNLSLLSWERGLKFFRCVQISAVLPSLLSWERGLKSSKELSMVSAALVAPLVGAWIEMLFFVCPLRRFYVAPLVGAWIEIVCTVTIPSLNLVAPLVGAWIEIRLLSVLFVSQGRSSRGSGD